MLDSELAARLTAHAFDLVETTYSQIAVLRRIALLTEHDCPDPVQ
jgi:hypothetical protein